MAQTIIIMGASYPDVPSIEVPKTSGGTASYIDSETVITYYTSSSNPTSSDGSDGDIWLVTS